MGNRCLRIRESGLLLLIEGQAADVFALVLVEHEAKRESVSAYARKLDVQARGCLHDGPESLQRFRARRHPTCIVVQNDDGNFIPMFFWSFR